MGNAGRVLMIPKGDYNAATTYEMLDFVYYQGRSYVCKQTSTGNAPTNTTYWQALTGDASAEIQALTNQLTDEVTTRAALGAHNLFGVGNSLDEWFAATNDGKLPTNYLASDTITGTVNKDTNSVVITAYNTSGYRWGCKKINLKKNTRYTFSRTSCSGTIQLFGKNNADDRAVVISGLSNGGTINSGDYDWWYVGFYPTRSGGYFSITDLLVRLETDADSTFQPYAKTNVELTEMTAISSGTATAGSHVGNTPVYTQFGKMVVVNLLLNVNGAVANDEALLTNLPQCSSSGGRNTVIGDSSGHTARVRIASNSTSIISEGSIANTGWYSGQLIYFTD